MERKQIRGAIINRTLEDECRFFGRRLSRAELCEPGAPLNKTLLQEAAENFCLGDVASVMDEGERFTAQDFLVVNDSGENALGIAAMCLQHVAPLLKEGEKFTTADFLAPTAGPSLTPLFQAMRNGHLKEVLPLLPEGEHFTLEELTTMKGPDGRVCSVLPSLTKEDGLFDQLIGSDVSLRKSDCLVVGFQDRTAFHRALENESLSALCQRLSKEEKPTLHDMFKGTEDWNDAQFGHVFADRKGARLQVLLSEDMLNLKGLSMIWKRIPEEKKTSENTAVYKLCQHKLSQTVAPQIAPPMHAVMQKMGRE